jgi:hypothetical protein
MRSLTKLAWWNWYGPGRDVGFQMLGGAVFGKRWNRRFHRFQAGDSRSHKGGFTVG